MIVHQIFISYSDAVQTKFPAIASYFSITKFIAGHLGSKDQLEWELDDFKITMSETKTVERQFKARGLSTTKRPSITIQIPVLDKASMPVIDVNALVRGFPPNLIHSLDGKVARNVVKTFKARGYNIVCIHDCFLVTPNLAKDLLEIYSKELLTVGLVGRKILVSMLSDAVHIYEKTRNPDMEKSLEIIKILQINKM